MPADLAPWAYFKKVDELSLDSLIGQLSFKIDRQTLENSLASRLAYPRTVSLTKTELEIDRVLLKALLTLEPQVLWSDKNKLIIPESFIHNFGPLDQLVVAILSCFDFSGVAVVIVKVGNVSKVVGSVVRPEKLTQTQVELKLNQQETLLKKVGEILSLALDKAGHLKVGDQNFNVTGGELGVVVDLS